jgi:rhodanese-related sulfurtransferase
LGYLKGGIDAWKESGREIDTLESVSAETLKEELPKGILVFDVRNQGEYASAHLEQAKHAPLGFLNSYLNDFPSTEKCYIHCAGGYRSVIAASILKSRGIHNVVDVAGGFAAMKNAGIIVEN